MTKINREDLEDICRYGRLAPSVHNIQPWEFEITDNILTIHLSKKRTLSSGDPVGRESWISIGACVETCLVAGLAKGLEGTVARPTSQSVTITFATTKKTPTIKLANIPRRFSDRSVYKKKPIDSSLLRQIETCWSSTKSELRVIDDRRLIGMIAELTGRGMTLAMQSSEFRNELAQLINRPLSRKDVGFSYHSLRVNALQGLLQPMLARSKRSTRYHRRQEIQRMNSAAALVMVFTDGDTHADWLEAGRAYQRAGLVATELGLRQATSAAVVEATDFHTDIEDYLGTSRRLQTLMRIGYSSKKQVTSPRISTKSLIAD